MHIEEENHAVLFQYFTGFLAFSEIYLQFVKFYDYFCIIVCRIGFFKLENAVFQQKFFVYFYICCMEKQKNLIFYCIRFEN